MKVILYTTSTCVFCPLVKNFLKEKEVEYEEVDVSKDAKALEEIKEKTGQMGVPVTLIRDKVVIGFDKNKLTELLNL